MRIGSGSSLHTLYKAFSHGGRGQARCSTGLVVVVCCFGAVSFVVVARSCLRFYGLFALLVVGPCMLLLVAMLVGHYNYQLDICAKTVIIACCTCFIVC